MERGALGSELDDNPAERRAIWSRQDSSFSGYRLHPSSTTTLWYADFEVYPCTAVTTVISRMTLYALRNSCVAFPALEAGLVYSGRDVL